jgi:hypothetical protein
MADATATIRRDTGTATINVRKTPGRNQTNIHSTLPIGTANLVILEVKEDEKKEKANNKVYQWFKVRLPNNAEGWVRDDLIDIVGDCSAFGYGVLETATQASSLKRNPVIQQPSAPVVPPTTPTTPAPTTPSTPSTAEADRIRKVAFNITSTFEGGGEDKGYTMYQNNESDAGVVSFGRFQFTLTAGTLGQLLDRYLAKASSDTATQLKNSYLDRIKKKDKTLRTDETLKALLRASGLEQAMKDAQNALATDVYWKDAQKRHTKYNIQTALGQALIFDMMIHHGPGNLDTRYLDWTVNELKLPATWKSGDNGTTEQQFITRLAQRRKDELYRQAGNKASGLKVRGDFWFTLVQNNDWNLQGDAKGIITPKSGRTVNAKNPL